MRYFTISNLNNLNSWYDLYTDNKVSMTETGFTVSLPGIGKENIEVIDTNDTVKINWSDKRVSSSHKDSISIPVEGHSDIAAEYKDGILTVNITKKDTSKKVVIS